MDLAAADAADQLRTTSTTGAPGGRSRRSGTPTRTGNPATTADPTWQPLFVPTLDPAIAGAGPPLITPPFPEHPSGHLYRTSSSVHALQAFLGDQRPDLLCHEHVASRSSSGASANSAGVADEVTGGSHLRRGIHARTPDGRGELCFGERGRALRSCTTRYAFTEERRKGTAAGPSPAAGAGSISGPNPSGDASTRALDSGCSSRPRRGSSLDLARGRFLRNLP